MINSPFFFAGLSMTVLNSQDGYNSIYFNQKNVHYIYLLLGRTFTLSSKRKITFTPIFNLPCKTSLSEFYQIQPNDQFFKGHFNRHSPIAFLIIRWGEFKIGMDNEYTLMTAYERKKIRIMLLNNVFPTDLFSAQLSVKYSFGKTQNQMATM